MAEDISHQMSKVYKQISEEHVTNKLLNILQCQLSIHGKSLSDFSGMPQTSQDKSLDILNYQVDFCPQEQQQLADKNELLLNTDQLAAYKTVLDAIHSNTQQKSFFIDGPGGSGKTFLYNTLLARVRSEKRIALAVASSGIAAELLNGGRTAHSTFKIPIPIQEISTCNISKQSTLAELIRQTSIIIWDEAPMVHKYVLECVHRTLCDVMECDDPFGGKVFLLGGDFRQVLPIIRHGTQADIIESNGTQKNVEDGTSIIELPKHLCIEPGDNGLQQLIQSVYPNLTSLDPHNSYLGRAILTTTNENVDKINKLVMDQFQDTPHNTKTYLSADTVSDQEQQGLYPTEFLNTLTPSGTPPHKLYLKKGVPIILLRNINPTEGLLNGTRMCVRNLGDRIIEAEVLTGQHAGNIAFLPRITIIPSDAGLPFDLKRRQFPVRPAFAMTINKSQDQTLDHIGLDLTNSVFSHGQL